MSRHLFAAAIAAGVTIAVAVPAAAGDYTQLARSAGYSVAASLDEIAAAKFNADGRENEQTLVGHMSAGGRETRPVRSSRAQNLDNLHLELINASVSSDERQQHVARDGTRSNALFRRQLAASVGILEPGAMTLDAVAAAKFGRDQYGSN